MKFIKENIHLAMNDNVSSLTEFETLSKIKKDTHMPPTCGYWIFCYLIVCSLPPIDFIK